MTARRGVLSWAAMAAAGLAGAGARAKAVAPETPGSRPGHGLVALSDGRLVAPDIARILQRGELVVAMEAEDRPPFFYREGAGLAGSDVVLAQALARSLGVEARFERSSHNGNDVVQRVARAGADVGISKLARTLSRTQSVLFSTPYMKLNHALLIHRASFARVAAGRSFGEAVRDFRGTLGVIDGSSWVEVGAVNFPRAQVLRYPTWEATVEAVRRGQVTAIYRDDFEIRDVMRADPRLSLVLRAVTFEDLHSVLSIAVGLRDLALLAYVNEFIAQRAQAAPRSP